jgi:ammonium transporter Rh
LGKTTLTQLVVLALIEVVVQVANEYLNVNIIRAHDTGRSVYVHLFGALFGLAASKILHLKSVNSFKQSSVYHSDIFALIGTLFLWAFYPSFNGLLAKNLSNNGQTKAIVNTVASICASCVVTFGTSNLLGNGKLNTIHIQHATIAGGIAIGSVADLNVQVYVALLVGSLAGLISTLGYQFIDPFLKKTIKLHDTCGVQSLHAWPGLISGILGIIYAAVSSVEEYKSELASK